MPFTSGARAFRQPLVTGLLLDHRSRLFWSRHRRSNTPASASGEGGLLILGTLHRAISTLHRAISTLHRAVILLQDCLFRAEPC